MGGKQKLHPTGSKTEKCLGMRDVPASCPLDGEKEGAALLRWHVSLPVQFRGQRVVRAAYTIVAARAGLFGLSLLCGFIHQNRCCLGRGFLPEQEGRGSGANQLPDVDGAPGHNGTLPFHRYSFCVLCAPWPFSLAVVEEAGNK